MTVIVDTRLRSVVGDRSAKALENLDIFTVGDLLRHYPRRYIETGSPSDLSGLYPGQHRAP